MTSSKIISIFLSFSFRSCARLDTNSSVKRDKARTRQGKKIAASRFCLDSPDKSKSTILLGPIVIRLKRSLSLPAGRLSYDGHNYFVMLADGTAAPTIIYRLCERRDCRNPRDGNPLQRIATRARRLLFPPLIFAGFRINYDGTASSAEINARAYPRVNSNIAEMLTRTAALECIY